MASTKLRRYTCSKSKDTDTPLFEAKIDGAASQRKSARRMRVGRRQGDVDEGRKEGNPDPYL